MELKKSLAPVINKNSTILILGSMPGEESLRRQEYYGFKGNQFWRLAAAVLGTSAPESYPEKLAMLAAGKIALWDVIASCSREGSLDTNIKNESPNAVHELLHQYPDIKAVFFNGQKAESSFKRSFGLNLLTAAGISCKVLPSSSPAHTVGVEKKLEEWMEIKKYLIL